MRKPASDEPTSDVLKRRHRFQMVRVNASTNTVPAVTDPSGRLVAFGETP